LPVEAEYSVVSANWSTLRFLVCIQLAGSSGSARYSFNSYPEFINKFYFPRQVIKAPTLLTSRGVFRKRTLQSIVA
jgi:hypothetical protein